jgi:hypothetical protein
VRKRGSAPSRREGELRIRTNDKLVSQLGHPLGAKLERGEEFGENGDHEEDGEGEQHVGLDLTSRREAEVGLSLGEERLDAVHVGVVGRLVHVEVLDRARNVGSGLSLPKSGEVGVEEFVRVVVEQVDLLKRES